MNELNLVGLHEDGESLVLECAGQRYTLRIDDALRAAVRRDRPQLERARDAGTMPVREIQARIRAGASAEEVAELAGMSVDRVHRYDGPVLAEREHVVTKARAALVGGDGSPVFDELVTDRLAARGVDPGDVAWDSARDASGEWRVSARFTAGGTTRSATWRYDAGGRSVTAVDDEARWLSETETGTRDVLPRSSATARESEVVRAVLSPVDARDATPDAVATDALLDDLGRRRGQRADAAAPWRDEPTRHPSRSRPAMTIDLPHLAGTRSMDEDGTDGPGDRREHLEEGPTHTTTADRSEQAEHDAQVVAFHPRPEPRTESRPVPRTESRTEPRTAGAAAASDASGDPGTDDGRGADGPTRARPRPDEPGARTGATPSSAAAAGERATADHVGPGAARRGRRSRTKIPSWDEIMFGSRPEQ